MSKAQFNIKIFFEKRPIAKKNFQNIKELDGIIKDLKRKFK